METQIITLTPPIDGVQYGYSETESPNDGEYGYNKNSGILQSIGLSGKINSDKKLICSTNPKDTRFPFLVMPSKKQEVEKLIYGCFGKAEWDAVHKNAKLALIETFMNNPAKYTQEDMKKCWEQAKYIYENDISEVQSFKQYLQSLQPTAKAVRVEMVDNGYEVDMEGRGGMELGETCWLSKIEIKVETSSEYPQRIVRAIEVIY